MRDADKTKAQLQRELAAARQQIAELEALKDENTPMNRLFNLSVDMLCVSSHDGFFLKVNPAFTKTFGYDEDELLGKPFLDFIHPEDKDRTIDVIGETSSTGKQILQFQNRYRCKNGSYRWLEWTAQPSAKDGVTYAAARDITKKKQIEEDLLISENQYRTLFERSSDALLTILLPDAKVIDANIAAVTMFGYSKEEFKELTRQQIIAPEAIEETDYQWQTQLEKAGRFSVKTIWVSKDGSRIPVSVNGHPLELLGRSCLQLIIRDITQRKQAEKSLQEANQNLKKTVADLRESEQLFNLAVNATRDGIWDWKIADDEHYFTPRAYEILDCSPDDLHEPHEFDFWVSRIHPDDFQRVMDAVKAHLEEREVYNVDYRYRSKSGKYRWHNSRGQAIFNENGEPIRIVGCIRDITEQKQAESALKDSEKKEKQFQERLRELCEVSNELSTMVDLDGLCHRAVGLGRSRLGFERLGIWFFSEDSNFVIGSFGVDEEGKIRDERNQRLRTEDPPLPTQLIETNRNWYHEPEASLFNHEGEVVGKGERAAAIIWDGEEILGYIGIDNLLSTQPITEQDGEILGLYASTIGYLSSRLRAEEALRTSIEQIKDAKLEWETTVDSLPQLICPLDSQGHILRANQVIRQWNLGEVIDVKGRGLHELFHSRCTDPNCYLKRFWTQAQEGLHQQRSTECEVYDQNLKRFIHIQIRPILTQINREDSQPESVAVAIVHDITETQELREHAQRMNRLAALGQLAATVTHEIRNPLGAINFNFQHLCSQLDIPDDYQEVVTDINFGIQRIQNTVRAILDFTRLPSSALAEANIHRILNQSVRAVANEFQSANLTITKNYESKKTSILADVNQITQVFINLFLNAKQAMSSGGHLVIRTSNRENSIEVTVEDTGKGIPPEDLDKIFDPFFTTKVDGIGLGLAIVFRVVEQHHGQITVESQVGVGTKFALRFAAKNNP